MNGSRKGASPHHRGFPFVVQATFATLVAVTVLYHYRSHATSTVNHAGSLPHPHAESISARCQNLNAVPTPPPYANRRTHSDRFEPGTKAYLIRNANIWTGFNNGTETIYGDILLDNGIIKAVGRVGKNDVAKIAGQIIEYDAKGAWVTPGIVDMHSHMGDSASPAVGPDDGNSLHGPIVPWLRSIDSLNTHDDGYQLSVAGGITTALILPGSANAIGGEAFVMKPRPTKARTPTSFLVEPPFSLNGTSDPAPHLRWRHMKHACGENPARVYQDTRMDTVWKVRQAYDTARKIKLAQDEYCSKVKQGQWHELGDFPEDLQWESMVAILRGQVKVQTHCYEATDITNFVRLSQEFQFEIAAFHHAHEAYLVPNVIHSAYGKPPAIAMFAAFSRYKREAYRHSHFAPKILADAGIEVIMKSDHPAISRTLLHEAQQAHYYGLPQNLALSSVISTPAKVLGLDWRIGHIKPGYDADVVVWDSHPLSLGATPAEVWIDGMVQFGTGIMAKKPVSMQNPPRTPKWDNEIAKTIEHEGLPPLEPSTSDTEVVVFTNVSTIWERKNGRIVLANSQYTSDRLDRVIFRDGKIDCVGNALSCADIPKSAVHINLEQGSLAPGLTSAGSMLGLSEISMEESTTDGAVLDPLVTPVPKIVGSEQDLVRAADGLQFGTRDALLAYRAGVTHAISPPQSSGFIAGLSSAFSLGANSRLANGAIHKDIAGIHLTISMNLPYSVSTQIAALRRLLLYSSGGETGNWFRKAAEGKIPLAINVHNADIMATLLSLKKEVESITGASMRMIFVGGTESHMLAKELAREDVGVILTPPRSFPFYWEQRRILPGPPITSESIITNLVRHNVTVGLGPQGVQSEPMMGNWAVQNLRWDAGWAFLEGNGTISREEAHALVSTNIERLFGVDVTSAEADVDYVATKGGDLLDFHSQVVAVVSSNQGKIHLF